VNLLFHLLKLVFRTLSLEILNGLGGDHSLGSLRLALESSGSIGFHSGSQALGGGTSHSGSHLSPAGSSLISVRRRRGFLLNVLEVIGVAGIGGSLGAVDAEG